MQNYIVILAFMKNANFPAENCRKSPNMVIKIWTQVCHAGQPSQGQATQRSGLNMNKAINEIVIRVTTSKCEKIAQNVALPILVKFHT
jgi:hypothetical protein